MNISLARFQGFSKCSVSLVIPSPLDLRLAVERVIMLGIPNEWRRIPATVAHPVWLCMSAYVVGKKSKHMLSSKVDIGIPSQIHTLTWNTNKVKSYPICWSF